MSNSIEALMTDLRSDRPDVRRRAAERLAQLGEQAAEAAGALVEATGDADGQVREYAVAALEGLGPPPASLEAALIRQLNHAEANVGYWAATLLGRVGAAAWPAIGPLTYVLRQSPHRAVRQRSAWALGQVLAAAGRHDLEPALRGELETGLKEAIASSDRRLARLAQEALDHVLEELP